MRSRTRPATRTRLLAVLATAMTAATPGAAAYGSQLRLEVAGPPPIPLPGSYDYGRIYRLLLTVDDPDPSRQRFGFELGSAAGCPFSVRAGRFALLDPNRTQLTSDGRVDYVAHAC